MKLNEVLIQEFKNRINETWKSGIIKGFMKGFAGGEKLSRVDLKTRKKNLLDKLTKEIHGKDSWLKPDKLQVKYLDELSDEVVTAKHQLEMLKDLQKTGADVADDIEKYERIYNNSHARLKSAVEGTTAALDHMPSPKQMDLDI